MAVETSAPVQTPPFLRLRGVVTTVAEAYHGVYQLLNGIIGVATAEERPIVAYGHFEKGLLLRI